MPCGNTRYFIKTKAMTSVLKKFNPKVLFPLLFLVLVIFLLSSGLFGLPPLGKFLDPFGGFAKNGLTIEAEGSKELTLEGLNGPVNVYFDDRLVPHIFAQNDEDLFYAQGFVTAKLRLWQMDFLSRAPAGRLSEVIGESTLEMDRESRRVGLLIAAERSLKLIESDPVTKEALDAYTSGVNAYIDQLSKELWPIEFKFFDYEPEYWTNLKSVLIMKYMGDMLTGYEEDVWQTNSLTVLGAEEFGRLFPRFLIEPEYLEKDSLKSDSVPPFEMPAYLDYPFMAEHHFMKMNEHNPSLGSNNWVVSGQKTSSGKPILCNDPHLNLAFPSVWLEMQLSSPSMNTYGVTIPGTPAVIIGYNTDIAWGVTNGATDVRDWYKVKLSGDGKKYLFEEEWLDLDLDIQTYKVKGKEDVVDTTYWTQHGPIAVDEKDHPSSHVLNYALKWELHQPSNEFLGFININKAQNLEEFDKALETYGCPIQNFIFASNDNDIAIRHQGKIPKKWQGQGQFVLDGTRKDHLYDEYLEASETPRATNPEKGYLYSANNNPITSDFPHFIHGFYSETRAVRIAEMLEKGNAFDVEQMQEMQLDNINVLHRDGIAELLQLMKDHSFDDDQQKLIAELKNWDGSYAADQEIAWLADAWWKNFMKHTWDEFDQYEFFMRKPTAHVLLRLIKQEPNDRFFDKLNTSEKEGAGDIAWMSFVEVAEQHHEKVAAGESLLWGKQHLVNIYHLTNLLAFSETGLEVGGHPRAINAMSTNWGPSWRMIVDFSAGRPQGFGVYPGGQSGELGTVHSDQFVDDWVAGKYYELHLFQNEDEAMQSTVTKWSLIQ
jgi:penicillin amidase